MTKPESDPSSKPGNIIARRTASSLMAEINRVDRKESAETISSHGAILTVQIKNFDDLFATFDPEIAVTTLRDYLDPIAGLDDNYDGMHQGYRGEDQLTLQFTTFPGMHYEESDTSFWERRAVKTALSIRGFLAEMNSIRAEEGKPVLEIGLGIESGHLLHGRFRGENLAAIFAKGEPGIVSGEIARLTTDLNCDILIGENTNEAVRNFVETREVYQFVSGTNLLVKVYQVFGANFDKLV